MLNIAQRGAADMQHVELLDAGHPSWDDLLLFLRCAEAESFRRAADRLGLSSSTVTRRMERLEKALGVRLFERLPEGIVTTQEAEAILDAVRRMEQAAFDVRRTLAQPDERARGLVKLSVTEGLGSYWIVPRLVEFQRAHPDLVIDLRCAMDSADVLRLEADMAIQFARPTSPDLMVVKLGRLHVYPFVARSYSERFGLPQSIADMQHHRLVDQVGPQLDEGAWARHLKLQSVEGIVGIRTNASTALFYAVEKGAGIGALPSYASALGAPVVPVDIGIRHQMDIWLTFHKDARKTRRVAYLIEWVKSIFDPKVYPWFRDEFIHPSELARMTPPEAEVNMGRDYFAAAPHRRRA